MPPAMPASSALPLDRDDTLDAGLRQFYAEIVQALQHYPDLAEPGTAEPAARAVQRQLLNLIELQTLAERRAAGRAAHALIAPVRYLKAALADELLLSRPWAGRGAWSQCLLEAELFRTSVAGDTVLTEIERLLTEREPAQRPLARLYLFALALGFQGRLRDQPELSRLAGLRQELYQFVYQRAPELEARDRVLSPQTYTHTASHLAPRRQRSSSRWTLGWLLAVGALLVLSELLWLWPTWSLRMTLESGSAVPGGRIATEVAR